MSLVDLIPVNILNYSQLFQIGFLEFKCICHFVFQDKFDRMSYLKDGLNFKGNEVKSKKNSKMWWNGTQNIYILIFMVLCILWIFSPKPSACFKAIFRLLLVPSKMYYWELLWVGKGWGLWGLGTKSSFPHPYSNFCVFSPLPETIFEHKHWVSCVLFLWVVVRHFIFLEWINFWSFRI